MGNPLCSFLEWNLDGEWFYNTIYLFLFGFSVAPRFWFEVEWSKIGRTAKWKRMYFRDGIGRGIITPTACSL
jgi:hypothetical protein